MESSEYQRYAAVLVCKEMAEQGPAVFNVHVKTFIDKIWSALRDSKLLVREAAVQALKVTTGLPFLGIHDLCECMSTLKEVPSEPIVTFVACYCTLKAAEWLKMYFTLLNSKQSQPQ